MTAAFVIGSLCDGCAIPLGADECCPACGVYHGDPCAECGRGGLHADGCSQIDGYADTLRPTTLEAFDVGDLGPNDPIPGVCFCGELVEQGLSECRACWDEAELEPRDEEW